MSVLNAFFHFTRHAVHSNSQQLDKSTTPGLTAAGPRSRDGPAAVARCGCILVCVVNVVYTRFAENNNDDKRKKKKKITRTHSSNRDDFYTYTLFSETRNLKWFSRGRDMVCVLLLFINYRCHVDFHTDGRDTPHTHIHTPSSTTARRGESTACVHDRPVWPQHTTYTRGPVRFASPTIYEIITWNYTPLFFGGGTRFFRVFVHRRISRTISDGIIPVTRHYRTRALRSHTRRNGGPRIRTGNSLLVYGKK